MPGWSWDYTSTSFVPRRLALACLPLQMGMPTAMDTSIRVSASMSTV